MRPNPGSGVEAAITELAVGEALVSLRDEKARPCPTERMLMLLPGSRIGPITVEERSALIAGSLVAGVYEKAGYRESAYERLKGRVVVAGDAAAAPSVVVPSGAPRRIADRQRRAPRCTLGRRHRRRCAARRSEERLVRQHRPARRPHEGIAELAARSAMRSIGSSVGREIVRGVLGSLLGERR